MTSKPRLGRNGQHARQRGVVLFVALVVLIAMTMAGLALMRASGTGILAAGNLAFKQSATASGDAGIEAARAWLLTQTAAGLLDATRTADAYYAFWDTAFNPVTSNVWREAPGSPDAAGNKVEYVIHRMCPIEGSLTEVPSCVTVAGGSVGGSKGGIQYGERALQGSTTVYYRVTARIEGPKKTLSFVQAMVY